MRLVTMTSASKPSIAINATQRAIRARITPCMARPPEPRRPSGRMVQFRHFGGEIGTGMRIVPAEFVTRPGASGLASLMGRPSDAEDYTLPHRWKKRCCASQQKVRLSLIEIARIEAGAVGRSQSPVIDVTY